MPDKYRNFRELSQNERAGVDYRILLRQAKAGFAIVTPHGGGIEPGASEIADAIAGEEFSFYAFEGLKSLGNTDLHITATRFDETTCLTVIHRFNMVVTIHGEHSEADGEGVFVGGLDDILGARLGVALKAKGFDIRKHPNRKLQGLETKNLCNRGHPARVFSLNCHGAFDRRCFRRCRGRAESTPHPSFATWSTP